MLFQCVLMGKAVYTLAQPQKREIFSDHCAITFQLNSKVFVKEKQSKSIQVWNFSDSEDWEMFNRIVSGKCM